MAKAAARGGDGNDELLQLRLPADLKRRFEKLAKDDDRTLSSYGRRVIERHCDEEEARRRSEK